MELPTLTSHHGSASAHVLATSPASPSTARWGSPPQQTELWDVTFPSAALLRTTSRVDSVGWAVAPGESGAFVGRHVGLLVGLRVGA